jgi:hypothetical protein
MLGSAPSPSLKHPIESKPIQVKELLMEDFAALMRRLVEIQSGGRERSPELIAEGERLMDGLWQENPNQPLELSQDSP